MVKCYKPGEFECERCGRDNEYVTKLPNGEYVCIDCLEDDEWEDEEAEN